MDPDTARMRCPNVEERQERDRARRRSRASRSCPPALHIGEYVQSTCRRHKHSRIRTD
jgi:hypothetical protein